MAKPYKLLREALERSSKAAVAKFALRGRERLGLLRIKEDAIVLHSMRWPDEVRSPAELAPPPVEVEDSEVDGALALMEAMGQEDLSEFHDEYREALERSLPPRPKARRFPRRKPRDRPGRLLI
ncbi:Ku protein [Streptomyces sp. NPDC002835]